MTIELTEPVAIRLTPEQYEALPPNSRIELVDAVVHVMTTPTVRHQDVVKRLERALEALCPRELRVVREQEIRLSADHRRNPDLMLVRATAVDPDGYSFAPRDVLLAIEVVSPGTETIDRLHKPAEYARARVEHYWRVEPSPVVVVHTCRLGYRALPGERPVQGGRHGQGSRSALGNRQRRRPGRLSRQRQKGYGATAVPLRCCWLTRRAWSARSASGTRRSSGSS